MTKINLNQQKDYQDIEDSVHSRFVVLTNGIFNDYCKKNRDNFPHRRKIRWRRKFVQFLIIQELHRINDYISKCVKSHSPSAYREVIISSILYERLDYIGVDYIYSQYYKKYQNE